MGENPRHEIWNNSFGRAYRTCVSLHGNDGQRVLLHSLLLCEEKNYGDM